MIKLVFEISEPINSVWLALTDPVIIADWTGTDAVMGSEQGDKFSLWGGDIWGVNTKMVEPTTIMQDWYAEDWAKPSKLVINLEAIDDTHTKVYLEHSGLPTGSQDDYEAGWDEYYFTPIKKLLESKP